MVAEESSTKIEEGCRIEVSAKMETFSGPQHVDEADKKLHSQASSCVIHEPIFHTSDCLIEAYHAVYAAFA